MGKSIRVPVSSLTVEALKLVIRYEPETGLFFWHGGRGARKSSRPAGNLNMTGYRSIRVLNCDVKAHRLAWFMTYGKWPSNSLDHINRNRDDNRIANLREATRLEQSANRTRHKLNKSGCRGVEEKPNGRWQASIRMNGKRVHLGRFGSKEEARAAYDRAALAHFGERYAPYELLAQLEDRK